RRHPPPRSFPTRRSSDLFNHDRVEVVPAKMVLDTIAVFESRLVCFAARSLLSHCSIPFTRGMRRSESGHAHASPRPWTVPASDRSEEHTSELQSRFELVF